MTIDGRTIRIKLKHDPQAGSGPLESSNKIGKKMIQSYGATDNIPDQRPSSFCFCLSVESEEEVHFKLKMRLPNWANSFLCTVDGKNISDKQNGYLIVEQTWRNNQIRIEFERELRMVPLPGNEQRVAFADGPLVLAGIAEKDQPIYFERVEDLLKPLNERHHSFWRDSTYITSGQNENITFVPIATITNQKYSIYFEKK